MFSCLLYLTVIWLLFLLALFADSLIVWCLCKAVVIAYRLQVGCWDAYEKLWLLPCLWLGALFGCFFVSWFASPVFHCCVKFGCLHRTLCLFWFLSILSSVWLSWLMLALFFVPLEAIKFLSDIMGSFGQPGLFHTIFVWESTSLQSSYLSRETFGEVSVGGWRRANKHCNGEAGIRDGLWKMVARASYTKAYALKLLSGILFWGFKKQAQLMAHLSCCPCFWHVGAPFCRRQLVGCYCLSRNDCLLNSQKYVCVIVVAIVCNSARN